MPATASRRYPAERSPRGGRRDDDETEVMLATSEVNTCAHSDDGRAIGIDWKRSKMPPACPRKSRYAGGAARCDRDEQNVAWSR